METVTHRRAKISIGTVTTGAPGTDASATMTDGQILNLVIPRGANGETGPAGPQGPKGDTGDAATNFKQMQATAVNTLCDEVLSESGEYVKPDSKLYYLDDVTGFRPLLQKLKAFFVPQSRTVNGHALSSNATLSAADVGAAAAVAKTVTLASGSWSSKAQTVSCAGVTTSNTVIVSPDPNSYLNYHKWKVRCTNQTDSGQLTFKTDGTPSADLTVRVLILNNVGT